MTRIDPRLVGEWLAVIQSDDVAALQLLATVTEQLESQTAAGRKGRRR